MSFKLRCATHKYRDESIDSQRAAGRVNPAEELVLDDLYRLEPRGERYRVILTGSWHGALESVALWYDNQDKCFYGVTRNRRMEYVSVTCWSLHDNDAEIIRSGKLTSPDTIIVSANEENNYFCDSADSLAYDIGPGWEDYSTWYIVRALIAGGYVA